MAVQNIYNVEIRHAPGLSVWTWHQGTEIAYRDKVR